MYKETGDSLLDLIQISEPNHTWIKMDMWLCSQIK